MSPVQVGEGEERKSALSAGPIKIIIPVARFPGRRLKPDVDDVDSMGAVRPIMRSVADSLFQTLDCLQSGRLSRFRFASLFAHWDFNS